MVGQGSLQGSLSRWKPIQVLPPPALSALAQRLPKRDCESAITTSLLPFISQFCCKRTSVTVQLVVNRAFLDYFVIDVAIILFNGKGFMIFTWRNLFLFTIIIFCRYFLFTYFPYAYICCTASAFPKTAEHTTMYSMLRTVQPFKKKCQF